VSRRSLLGFLGLVVVVLAALEVPLGVQYGRTERRNLQTKIEHDANSLASLSEDTLSRPTRARLDAIAAIAYRYRRDTGGRVVIVNRRGVAQIDTAPRGSGAETFASRPEMAAALRGVAAVGTRESKTLHTKLLYVAVPVAANGRVTGAVRITYPTSAVDARVRRYWLVLAAIAAIVLAVAVVVGIRLAAFVVGPLRRLEGAAEEVGKGDLAARAPENEGPPEVQSLAAVFNDTVAKLEQLLRSQEEFVADASHQLRTPLTALRLRLENLDRDVGSGGKTELAGAVTEVERLATLVDGLLALARADAGAAAAERVDVDALIGERVEAWSAFADEREIRLVARADGAPAVRAGADRVRQVLDNLVENAFEASPPGGTVTVVAQAAPPWVELRVRDEGPGLGPEERRRAFDRFWRAQTGEGSGLGLAIVRRLVEADGGSVELVEASSGGLEALVRLRAAQPAKPPSARVAPP
jgi:signal transduction histidine kinase